MGCLIGLILLPINFIRWAFENGWKGAIAAAIVLVLLVVGFFGVKGMIDKATVAKPTGTPKAILPGIKVAPYQVETKSRIYYAAKAIKNTDGTVTMTDYWETISGEWKLTKGILVLDKNYGTVTVRRR